MENYLKHTPWDKRNLHIDTYELTSSCEEALAQSNETEGHFTLKIDPLKTTEKLNKYGFYYVDTLIEPVCKKDELNTVARALDNITVTRDFDAKEVLGIAGSAFKGGRFHRDFNIPEFMADQRYVNWVKDLIEKDQILALQYNAELAGFYGYEENKILLLGVKEDFRGKGLAKQFLRKGAVEHSVLTEETSLRTSISPSNLASLNLFISLGFKLKGSVDVYHKLNGSLPVGV